MLSKYYAQALHKSLQGRNRESVDALFANFIAILRAKGHMSLLSYILKDFARIRGKEEKYNATRITVADKSAAKRYTEEAAEYAGQAGFEAKGAIIEEDLSLIGGFRAEKRDMILDRSFKRMLIELYRKFIAA
ncbi:MAG: F0F1 ATP synthase subunit delta [Patescibacteria group bacterium]